MSDDGPRPSGNGLDAALERIGDRWSLLVVGALMEGPKRFSDLQQAVPGLAANILTARLRRLERDHIVVGVPYSERPARYEYQVTPYGAELAGALRLLAHWGAQAAGEPADDAPRHAACGTPLEVRWFCPTCDRVTDGNEHEVAWL